MKEVTKIKIGNSTAIISFLIGTAIFLSYVISENDSLFLIGYIYLIAAILVNIYVLCWLLLQSSDDNAIKKGLNRSKIFIVANIPIAIGYFFTIVYLLSYLRITFVNSTGETITNVRIIGCDNKNISQLRTDQKETKWIGINGDCSVDIKYFINGEENQETVVGYASGPMGQRLIYEIGSNVEAIQ